MKRKIVIAVVVALVLSGCFALGYGWCWMTRGHYYQVIAQQEHKGPDGPVMWSYVSETTGLPFLDPGTSVIEYKGRIIYKARRMFQESTPMAQNIRTSGRELTWDDGEYQFRLIVDDLKK